MYFTILMALCSVCVMIKQYMLLMMIFFVYKVQHFCTGFCRLDQTMDCIYYEIKIHLLVSNWYVSFFLPSNFYLILKKCIIDRSPNAVYVDSEVAILLLLLVFGVVAPLCHLAIIVWNLSITTEVIPSQSYNFLKLITLLRIIFVTPSY